MVVAGAPSGVKSRSKLLVHDLHQTPLNPKPSTSQPHDHSQEGLRALAAMKQPEIGKYRLQVFRGVWTCAYFSSLGL